MTQHLSLRTYMQRVCCAKSGLAMLGALLTKMQVSLPPAEGILRTWLSQIVQSCPITCATRRAAHPLPAGAPGPRRRSRRRGR